MTSAGVPAAGGARDPGVRAGEDRTTLHRTAALRPDRVVRRLDVRHAAHLHPVAWNRPDHRAAQICRGSGECR